MADFCMVVFYDNGSKKDKKKKASLSIFFTYPSYGMQQHP